MATRAPCRPRYQTRTGWAVAWCSDEVAGRELRAVLEAAQVEGEDLAVGSFGA